MNFKNQLFMSYHTNYKISDYEKLEDKDRNMILQVLNTLNHFNYSNFEELEKEMKTKGIDSKYIVKYGDGFLEDKYVYLKDGIPVEIPYTLMNRNLGEHLSFVHGIIKNCMEKGSNINLFMIPQCLNLDFFLVNYDKFSLEQKRDMFDYLYQSLETDFHKFTPEVIKECFTLPQKDRETLQKFCNKNNELIIYRGENDLSTVC